jgi:hypothetical protein
MPRPALIEKIHDLKYQLREPRLLGSDFVKIQQEYDAAILEACRQYKCAKVELLTVLRSDFGRWVNQEELPWLYETESD